VVRNGQISARNSAPGVGTGSKMGKKASRNWLLRLALQRRGDWIRTSDLLNPIQCCEWEGQLLRDAAASTYDNRSQENVGAASRVSRRF
jgi:hypothetical protein